MKSGFKSRAGYNGACTVARDNAIKAAFNHSKVAHCKNGFVKKLIIQQI